MKHQDGCICRGKALFILDGNHQPLGSQNLVEGFFSCGRDWRSFATPALCQLERSSNLDCDNKYCVTEDGRCIRIETEQGIIPVLRDHHVKVSC